MTKLRQLSYAAVGASAEVLRTVTTTAEKVREELTTKLDEIDLPSRFNGFVETAAVDGRELVGRIPRAGQIFHAQGGAAHSIGNIPEVGTQMVSKLRAAGVTTVAELVAATKDRNARRHLATVTGIEEDEINRIGNLADLMRVDSIGPRYAQLLDAAGVVSTRQLRRRSASSLHETLTETNEKAKIVERVPALDVVTDWIEKAQILAD
ncbi:MAG: DUF4332 domain-containing protein [Acidimicrobiia bacterium]|nr:DUF4332 domain-containing protein [Acidimicrobiia bacterium]